MMGWQFVDALNLTCSHRLFVLSTLKGLVLTPVLFRSVLQMQSRCPPASQNGVGASTYASQHRSQSGNAGADGNAAGTSTTNAPIEPGDSGTQKAHCSFFADLHADRRIARSCRRRVGSMGRLRGCRCGRGVGWTSKPCSSRVAVDRLKLSFAFPSTREEN